MEIRNTRSEDLPELFDLFKSHEMVDETLDKKSFVDLFRWLFLDTSQPQQFTLVAAEAGALIAHTGMVPLAYRVDGKDVVGGLGANLLIDQKFRGGLLFFQFQGKYLREYNKAKIDFAYGLVNRGQVLETHLRTGYKRVGDMPVYARPYRVGNLIGHYLKNSLAKALVAPLAWVGDQVLKGRFVGVNSGIQVEEVQAFTQDQQAFVSELTREFSIISRRDGEILRWRFNKTPFRGYRIFEAREDGKPCGYVVVRKMRMQQFMTLALVDILFSKNRPDVGKALLARVHREAVREKVDLVSTLMNPHSYIRPLLSRFGFLKTPESFTLILNHPKGSSTGLDPARFAEWHLTWFDHDYV